MSTTKLNVWLFFWFFTNCAFVILALICNLKLHGFSPTLHHACLTRPKLLWVLELWIDSFDHTWHLGKLNWLLYSFLWKQFSNFFFLMSLFGSFARNVTLTSGLLLEFSCVISVRQLLPGYISAHILVVVNLLNLLS